MAAKSPHPITLLSPSQILLLRGELFVQTMGGLELVSGVKVAVQELAETTLAVAFLGCAAQGMLNLHIRDQQRLLGLRAPQCILATPGSVAVPWREGTLEDRLVRLAERLAPKDRHTVRRLVHNLLLKDSSDPWHDIVALVQEGLVEWWILEPIEGVHRLTAGEEPSVRLAPDVLEAVLDIDISPTIRLLEEGRSYPQKWGLLHTEISQGLVDRRTKPAPRLVQRLLTSHRRRGL